MNIRNYGRNFSLVEDDKGKSKNDIILAYQKWYGKKRQGTRKIIDLKKLSLLDDTVVYTIYYPQLTGHRDIPEGTFRNGYKKRIFTSAVIDW